MKYSFVDLDETLIHTDNFYMREHPDAVKVVIGGNDRYYSVPRPGAKEFLAKLRLLSDRVFMLTVATQDYAEEMNKVFDFGFKNEDIYSRYDVRGGGCKKPELDPGAVFLFDNLHRSVNFEKISFLKPYGELTYVQVEGFLGSGEFSPNYIDKLVSSLL
jgi:hypothetical protein